MSSVVLSASLVFLGIAALLYRFFCPKDSSLGLHVFVYASLTILLGFVLLYDFASRYLDAPWRYFLDMRYGEFNHSASFSSLLLFIAGASATSLSLFSPTSKLWERLYYLLLSLCFIFLAYDEYFMIYETLENWALIYLVIAFVMALMGMLLFWHSKPKHGKVIYLALFGGMALSAIGSIAVEELFGRNCLGLLKSIHCSDVPVIEELFETLGYIFAAAAVLQLVQQSHHRQRFVIWASAFWLAYILFSFWLQPALETRLIAEPLDLRFEEAPLLLEAVHLNQLQFEAGDSLSVDLYWRTAAITLHDYGYTVNLLDPVTGELLWRENLNIAYPSTKSWFLAVIYRSRYTFVIPQTIQSPVSAILSIALWRKEGENYLNFQGESVSRELFAGEFPVVSRLSILSPNESNPSPRYRFANGILLSNPELIRDDERHYRLRLRWSSEAVIDDSLNYFIHFLQEAGDAHLIFDRAPFRNRFPTAYWALGMNEVDELLLDMPEEAHGRYRVVIGLLRIDNGERIPVEDIYGNFLAEQSIPLGIVEIPAP